MPLDRPQDEDYDSVYNIEDAIRHNEGVERAEAAAENVSRRINPDGSPMRKKCVNFLWLDEDIFNLLSSAATTEGLKMELFCTKILSGAAAHITDITESADYRLESARIKARRWADTINAIESLAIEISVHPSEDMADLLTGMCDEIGIDPAEVRQKARRDPMAEAIAGFRVNPNTKTARCKKWMIDLMRVNSYKVSAQLANAQGKAMGFSKDIISNTRQRLSIQSSPTGKEGEFVWTLDRADRAAKDIMSGGSGEWGEEV